MGLHLKPKMIAAFLAVGLIPFVLISVIAVNNSSSALEEAKFNQLDGVRGIKKTQIEDFFKSRQSDAQVLSETTTTLMLNAFTKLDAVRSIKLRQINAYLDGIRKDLLVMSVNQSVSDAIEDLTKSWGDLKSWDGKDVDKKELLQKYYISGNPNPTGEKHKLNAAADGSTYSKAHGKYHPWFREWLQAREYYDIFLVDRSGDVVYTVFKELDFATNLKTGEWKDTDLGHVFAKIDENHKAGEVSYTDFAPYAPSYGAPAGFIGTPVYSNSGLYLGALIIQMPLGKINTIMSERTGLGETGDTYLVGSDMLMRSDSIINSDTHSVSASFADPQKGKAESETVKMALEGQSGSDITTNYTGNSVLSSFAPVDFMGVRWAMLAEVNVEEAFVPKDSKGVEFYKKYVDANGYADLYLILPNGYIFYNTSKEADLKTNLKDGKYKDTKLGQLFASVHKSNAFGISDFAPYQPANGVPAGFVAIPIIHPEKNKTEMVVALQIALSSLNNVMQHREGMGETGETYLVGADKLMRSDSLLNPSTHTVAASFASPSTGSVNTHAVQAALNGETGSEILDDYSGKSVLSAYAPITIGNTTWAMIAEIGESEAFEAISHLQTIMLIIAVVGMGGVATVGFFIASSIANPVVGMTQSMRVLADGNLNAEIPSQNRADEIGEMAAAVQVFKDHALRVKHMEAEQEESKRKAELQRKAALNHMAETFEKSVAEVVQTVSSSSTELEASAAQMSTTAAQTSDLAENVAKAATETSNNVQTVASAAEELSSSISEISRQVARSSEVARNAVTQAQNSRDTIQSLVEAAQSIGDVVNLITDIADQTNLLALNATIEAARAGDAGKGFAVVASEVKNLANQTAKATEEIGTQITNVQSKTQEAADSIGEVTKIIGEISSIGTAIASAVEEQGAATSEIARNIEHASAGTNEVSTNIQNVTQASGETGHAAAEISRASSELSKQSEHLRDEVNRFLSEIRADNKTANIYKWDVSLKTGVEKIDREHQECMDDLNTFHTHMMKGEGEAGLQNIISRLDKHVSSHFEDEESYMEKIRYPQLAEHKKEHDEFTRRFTALKADAGKGSVETDTKFFSYVSEWMREHFGGADKRYVEYAKQNAKRA